VSQSLFDQLAEQLAAKIRGDVVVAPAAFPEYAGDPIGFCRDVLHVELWSKQREVAEALRDHRQVTVRACHEVGKSYLAACLACWWVCTRPIGDAFVLTTAPTNDQVVAILWRYIKQLHARGNLPGVCGEKQWKINGQLVALGRKPSDKNPAGMQGIHALHVLFIVDEACGVAAGLWDAGSTLVANDNGRTLAIGNPDVTDGRFFKSHQPGSGWCAVRIAAWDSPNFTGEHVDARLRQLLVGPVWVEERRKLWGEGSPLWKAKVEGEFPDEASDALIPWKWIWAAQARELVACDPVDIGQDVGAGGDESVTAVRRGPVVRITAFSHERDTMKTTGQLVAAIRQLRGQFNTKLRAVKIDVIGIGKGVTDRVREVLADDPPLRDIAVVGVNVGEPPMTTVDAERFVRLRDQLCWAVRERFESGDVDIDPKDDELAAQLAGIKYALDSRGRIKVESKADMKKRGVHSPDRFDAVMLALAAVVDRRHAQVVSVVGA
jgi:hypothetical protein